MVKYNHKIIGGKALKNFFKKYSYLMVKLFITQCVIGLFGNVLALAGVKAESGALTIAISVFSIVFYLFLIYLPVWEVGNKDKSAIDGERIKFSPLTGLYIGLGANIPNYLLAIIQFSLLPLAKTTEGVFSAISGISNIIFMFINGTYTGILSEGAFAEGFALHDYWFMYFLISVPSLIVTTIAYVLGVKEIYLSKAMVPVNPEELEIKRDKKNNQK